MKVNYYKAKKENEERYFTSYFLDEIRLNKDKVLIIERLKIDIDDYLNILKKEGYEIALERSEEV